MSGAATSAPAVVMVVPGDVDDPQRPSGGNTYDRRLRDELRRTQWSVSWRRVPGSWPDGDTTARTHLAHELRAAPAHVPLLVDGLLACAAPDVVRPVAAHRPVVVLVHMPLGTSAPGAYALEGPVLRAASAVVVTSGWTRRWLLDAYALRPQRVHVARPGSDPGPVAAGTTGGGALLCVASVVPGKGHDVLVGALARVQELRWRCECVGALARDRSFVARVRDDLRSAGLSSRVVLTGPRTGAALASAYHAADVLVLPSRGETWGMVVTEALARGIPVIASDVGGVAAAMGAGTGGTLPGLLVPPEDRDALADALRRWLVEPDLRHVLRAAAVRRRDTLPGWDLTAAEVAGVLTGVAA